MQQSTIFITGVSRGIGKATAQKFLDEGYRVFGTSLSGELDYTHENLTPVRLDITNEQQVKDIVQYLHENNITLDILLNNAGVLLDEDDDEVVLDRLRATLEVNLIGTIRITQALLPFIVSGGKIINISSSAGQLERDLTSTRYPGYKISKTALNMYTVCLAKRLESKEITVSAVHPGWVRTDMGGKEADLAPEEAATYLFEFAHKDVETGKFWFKSERMKW